MSPAYICRYMRTKIFRVTAAVASDMFHLVRSLLRSTHCLWSYVSDFQSEGRPTLEGRQAGKFIH
jgi:hypothetical protein